MRKTGCLAGRTNDLWQFFLAMVHILWKKAVVHVHVCEDREIVFAQDCNLNTSMTVDTAASALAPETTSDDPGGPLRRSLRCVMEQLDSTDRFLSSEDWSILYKLAGDSNLGVTCKMFSLSCGDGNCPAVFASMAL